MHEPMNDSCMGMRNVSAISGAPPPQQPLPSVNHVMGPPQFRTSSTYPSPHSSQPATPLQSSSLAPSPSPGSSRLASSVAPSPSPGPSRMASSLALSPSPGSSRMLSMPSQNASPIPPPQPTQLTQPPPPYTRAALMSAPLIANTPAQFHSTSSAHLISVENEKAQTSSTSFQQVSQPTPKEQYRMLKKRFKFLVYENECYQEELRNLQRKLLKLSRDKNFLLDRLIQYEKLSDSSDDSDSNSVKTVEDKPKPPKKKSRPSASRRRSTVSKPKMSGTTVGKTDLPMCSPMTDAAAVESVKTEPDAATLRSDPSTVVASHGCPVAAPAATIERDVALVNAERATPRTTLPPIEGVVKIEH
uniref:INO80 complex subunit E n=1 Tax=Ascaris suum TaxID=6253 RepID=F1L7D0_ASCSU